jgi:hypothetical protein
MCIQTKHRPQSTNLCKHRKRRWLEPQELAGPSREWHHRTMVDRICLSMASYASFNHSLVGWLVVDDGSRVVQEYGWLFDALANLLFGGGDDGDDGDQAMWRRWRWSHHVMCTVQQANECPMLACCCYARLLASLYSHALRCLESIGCAKHIEHGNIPVRITIAVVVAQEVVTLGSGIVRNLEGLINSREQMLAEIRNKINETGEIVLDLRWRQSTHQVKSAVKWFGHGVEQAERVTRERDRRVGGGVGCTRGAKGWGLGVGGTRGKQRDREA